MSAGLHIEPLGFKFKEKKGQYEKFVFNNHRNCFNHWAPNV
jgi:hypothetical protein